MSGAPTENPPAFLIADDHAVFRRGLHMVLRNHWPEAVIEEVAGFTEALACPDEAGFSLIIADLRMPDVSGFDGLRGLRRRWPGTPIMALSASEEPDDVYIALEAGASGYLPKSTSLSRLIDVLELVMRGGIYVPRDLVGAEIRMPVSKPAPSLTSRQAEVLPLVAAGYSNKEIARRLGLSPGTVKAHLSAIMRQFGVNNRVRLLLELRDQEMGPASASALVSSSAPRSTA